MTGLEAFLGYLLNLAAEMTQRLFWPDRRRSAPTDGGVAGPKKTVERSSLAIRAVRFSTGEVLNQHKLLFGTTTVGDAAVAPAPAPKVGEQWKMESRWPAEDATLVEWSPRGKYLLTAADAFGMSWWRHDGSKVGRGGSETAYGTPLRIFFHPDGRLALLEAATRLNDWWTVYESGERLRQVVSRGRIFGYDTLNHSSFNRTSVVNPWRPGYEQLLLADYTPRLHLLDIRSLPLSSKSDKTLKDVPFMATLDLEVIGAQDLRIKRFHWHPNGQFVAVTTGNPETRAWRVHILHFNRGEIVATIPAPSISLGWSSGGRLLWCFKNGTGGGGRNEEVIVWDSHGWRCREPTSDELGSGVATKLLFCGTVSTQEAISADGQRVLKRLHIGVEGRSAVCIRETVKNEEVFEFPDEGEVRHAVWHPTDPTRLATVGGPGGSLMLWSLQSG